jgi:hypothetical protein
MRKSFNLCIATVTANIVLVTGTESNGQSKSHTIYVIDPAHFKVYNAEGYWFSDAFRAW